MASLAEPSASPWTAMSMRDRPARARPAPAACAALCVAMDGGRAADVDGLLVPIDRRQIRRRAGDDGPNAPRRDATRHSPPPGDIRVAVGW